MEGAILVGSHARGKARQDSDIDLVLLCTEYESYLEDVSWINDFGFTQLDWLVLPLDVGTVGVLRNGFQIVYDRSGKYLALEL